MSEKYSTPTDNDSPFRDREFKNVTSFDDTYVYVVNNKPIKIADFDDDSKRILSRIGRTKGPVRTDLVVYINGKDNKNKYSIAKHVASLHCGGG